MWHKWIFVCAVDSAGTGKFDHIVLRLCVLAKYFRTPTKLSYLLVTSSLSHRCCYGCYPFIATIVDFWFIFLTTATGGRSGVSRRKSWHQASCDCKKTRGKIRECHPSFNELAVETFVGGVYYIVTRINIRILFINFTPFIDRIFFRGQRKEKGYRTNRWSNTLTLCYNILLYNVFAGFAWSWLRLWIRYQWLLCWWFRTGEYNKKLDFISFWWLMSKYVFSNLWEPIT